MPKSRMAKRLPGISGWRACSEKSQAQTTTKAGFMNSEGWIEMPAMESQRIEPFTSSPMKSTSTIIASEPPRSRIAARLTWRGERKEIPTITTSDGKR
ncbi:hypothetical protein D9M70_635090 [compost metagenome]